MVRAIRGKDGKFAGSIGDGKTAPPAVGVPVRTAPVSAQASDTPDVGAVYAAFTAAKGPDMRAVTAASADADPVATGRDVMAAWNATRHDEGAWETMERRSVNDSTAPHRSRANPGVVIENTGFGLYRVTVNGKVVMDVQGDGRVLSSRTYQSPDTHETRQFDESGQLSNTKDTAAIVRVRKGEYDSHDFYSNGKYLGSQRWRILYDADGSEVPNDVFHYFAQKRATGGLGEQPPGYQAFN